MHQPATHINMQEISILEYPPTSPSKQKRSGTNSFQEWHSWPYREGKRLELTPPTGSLRPAPELAVPRTATVGGGDPNANPDTRG